MGARRVELTPGPARLYPVPDQPGLTAWTLDDWAHGQAYVPPALRQRPAATLETLVARERGTA